jgi:Fe-S cluster assembly scaffold protein SufB
MIHRMPEPVIRNPLSRRSVEALSQLKGEPGWMADLRLKAWDRYERLASRAPLPHALLRAIEAFTVPPRRSVPVHEWPEDLPHTLEERGDEEGTMIQRDATVLSRAMTKDATKRGVLFMDFSAAVRAMPETVKRSLEHESRLGDPLAALHTALWNGGTFLYVPAHVEIVLPFHTCSWLSQPGAALFPHTLIHVGPGSTAYFMDEYLSGDWRRPGLAMATVELEAAEKSQLFYFSIQNWGRQIHHATRETSQLASSARLTSLAASLGAQTDAVTLRLEATHGSHRRVESASAGPIDEAECAALTCQGVAPDEARYQVASRFFEAILSEVPNAPMREKLRHYVVGKVTGRRPAVTLHRTSELHPEIRL